MHLAVIGAGMIGSSAARHLAMAGHRVTLIGPQEPRDKASHTGVFGSHYDMGRITRAIDPHTFWARVSAESIARYAQIAEAGETAFYTEVGHLMTAAAGHPALASAQAVAHADGYAFQAYAAAEALNSHHAPYHFASGTAGLFEPRGAGYINPRALVQAQQRAAHKAGAVLTRREVHAVIEHADHVMIESSDGQVIADQGLVAAGAFSPMLVPEITVQVYARTILLAEVSVQDAVRFADLPPLIHCFDDADGFYLLPPIRYPDGRFYFKIGGDPMDVVLESTGDVQDWFRSGGDADRAALLEGYLRDVLPTVDFLSFHKDACVTTYTSDDLPLLKRIGPRLSIATAGCGKGAKCSDELGRLGALVALGEALPDWVRAA